jgi:hypothetical protein
MDVHLNISWCVNARREAASDERPVLRSGVWNHEGAK